MRNLSNPDGRHRRGRDITSIDVAEGGARAKVGGIFATHPEVKRLKAQIEALEKAPVAVAQAPATLGGYTRRTSRSIRLCSKGWASSRTSKPRLKNSQPRVVAKTLNAINSQSGWRFLNKPFRHKGPSSQIDRKLIALAFAAAVMAGFAGIWAVESIDKTIRSSQRPRRLSPMVG